MSMKKIRVNMVSESDISVQGHGVHTAYVELASALEKRKDVTVIRGDFGRQTDCDVVHLHTFGPRVIRKLLQKGPKKVISAHVVPASLLGSIIGAKYWLPLAKSYLKWYYRKGDKVLAVSGTVAKILEEDLGVSKDKIVTFYNTIDMQRYVPKAGDKKAARKRLDIADGSFVVVGNGQVQPRKRLDIFIKMANELPGVQFVWVGGIPFKQLGADYAKMQKLMESAPANLLITGVIPHEKVRDYLAAADVFCLPAEQENHPMCVLEAASAGLPIILRDIPEYNDTFGSDAIRVLDDGFVKAVKKLRDDKKTFAMQQVKTKAIADRFDSGEAAKRLVKMYSQLV
jgi:1,2-diacylglycerol-3-alpha-glucose alpha-1,2-galactosyltransferase